LTSGDGRADGGDGRAEGADGHVGGADGGERARALALLEANHEFPSAYSLSVIALNAEHVALRIATTVFEDVAPEALPPGAHERRPSSGGKYVSHRLTVQVASAEQVLTLYAKLRAIDGVMTIL
jgi:putative lipoic acid-binding regulatory protein